MSNPSEEIPQPHQDINPQEIGGVAMASDVKTIIFESSGQRRPIHAVAVVAEKVPERKGENLRAPTEEESQAASGGRLVVPEDPSQN